MMLYEITLILPNPGQMHRVDIRECPSINTHGKIIRVWVKLGVSVNPTIIIKMFAPNHPKNCG
jgi:hypothetical protein